MAVVVRMMDGLTDAGTEPETRMIDAIYLKAHRAASSLLFKKGDSSA